MNSRLPSLDDVRWNAIITWSFAAGEGIDDFAELHEGGCGVQFIHDCQ